MYKNFDEWNKSKKDIQLNKENKLYHLRDVWWCRLGVNVGFEEDGKGTKAMRPVLIMHGFSRQLCWAIPLTTSNKKNPYHISIGIINNQEQRAIISQMKPVDTKRLAFKIGYIEEEYFFTVKQAVKDILDDLFLIPQVPSNKG